MPERTRFPSRSARALNGNFPISGLPRHIPEVLGAALVKLPSTLLTRLDDAAPGDLTALVAGYSARFEDNETVHRVLEAFYLAGENGPAVKSYWELAEPVRAHAAQVALEDLFLGPCVHPDVLDWNLVHDPVFYTAYVFTFAEARIVMDARFLQDSEDLLFEIDDAEGEGESEKIRPCVIEIFGATGQLDLERSAHLYLQYVMALLPDNMRPEHGSYRWVQWD